MGDIYKLVRNPTSNKKYYYISGEDEDNNPIYTEGLYTEKTIENPQYKYYMNLSDYDKGISTSGVPKKNITENYINNIKLNGFLYKKDGDSCEDKLAKCEASKMSVDEKGGAKSVLAKQNAEKPAMAAEKNTKKQKQNQRNKVFYLL